MSKDYVLGLDVGERRIGVALASAIARLPAPLLTIDRQKSGDIFTEVKHLAEAHDAGVVVVGLPRNLNGEDTLQTATNREFAAALTQQLDIPVVLQDEAGTSVEAERLLQARGKAYEKGDIDAEAATLILRDYLNQTAGHTA